MPLPLPQSLGRGGRFEQWQPGVPHYVVADVDGTLLLRGTTATPVVAAAVGDARAAGLRVGFATGRLPVGVRDLHGQLAPDGPHIVHNGAQVRAEGRAVRTWPLDRGAAGRLVGFCMRAGLYAEFYVDDAMLVTAWEERARPVWEGISGEPDGLVADLDVTATDITKATVLVFEPAALPGVLEDLRQLGFTVEASGSAVLPGGIFVNVNSPQSDKGKALAFAAEHLGIPLADVVAVGDGPNDVSMLSVAGTAVAMGHAPAAVHAAAHVIVPGVEEDGVAHALRAAARWRADGTP
jgi:Cof subfamily protein (haloacid dehalogenase superfamily)